MSEKKVEIKKIALCMRSARPAVEESDKIFVGKKNVGKKNWEFFWKKLPAACDQPDQL